MNDDDQAMFNDFAFSPDGMVIAAGSCAIEKDFSECSQGEVIVWDTTTGKIINHFNGHEDTVSSVAFSPDGNTLLSGSRDKTLILWDMKTATPIQQFTESNGPIYDAIFSPDGRTILSFGGGLNLWDVNTGSLIRTFELPLDRDATLSIVFDYTSQSLLVFTADGLMAISAINDQVVVWDIASGSPLGTFSGHLQPIHDLSFNGKLVLSVSCQGSFMGCEGTQFIVWRIDTVDELKHWTLENRYVPELNCDQRRLYLVNPYCDADGNYPTRTP